MKYSKSFLRVLVCVISLSIHSSNWAEESNNQIAPLISVKTPKSMQQAIADLKEAIVINNYVLIRLQNIDSRLTDVAVENDQVILVYFCNFGMLNRALNLDNRIGVFLPCKIILIQRSGYIEMVAINPKLISKQIKNKRLNEICDQLTRDYNHILEDATI
jgi:cytochrome c oxidase cbb3-type subunit 3